MTSFFNKPFKISENECKSPSSQSQARKESGLERRQRDLRKKQMVREDLVHAIQRDAVLKSNLTSDERVENTRRLRALKERQEELDIQQKLVDVKEKIVMALARKATSRN